MSDQPFDALAAVMAHVDPLAIQRRTQAATACSAAAADLQEARHQLQAAELGDDEQAEAAALVRLRRAERKHTEAEQAREEADRAYRGALVGAWRAVRDVEYTAHEAFLIDAEVRVLAARQAAVDLENALTIERDQRHTKRITPLQAIAQQLQLPATEWMPNHQGKYA